MRILLGLPKSFIFKYERHEELQNTKKRLVDLRHLRAFASWIWDFFEWRSADPKV